MQSKEIAQQLRQKVNVEKKKQLKRIEKTKISELKRWQEKGIKRLQNELDACLQSFGEAHRAAEAETAREEEFKMQKKHFAYLAELRGKDAAMKLKKNKTPKKIKMKTTSTQVDNDLKENDDQLRNVTKHSSQKSKLKLSKDSKRNLKLGIDAMENLSKPEEVSTARNEHSTKLKERFAFLQNNSESDESDLLPVSKKIQDTRDSLFINDIAESLDDNFIKTHPIKSYNPNDFIAETSASKSLSLEPQLPKSVPQFNQVSQLLKQHNFTNLEIQKNVRFDPNVLREINLSPIDIPPQQTKTTTTSSIQALSSQPFASNEHKNVAQIIKPPSSIEYSVSPTKSRSSFSASSRTRSKSEIIHNPDRTKQIPNNTSDVSSKTKSVDMYDHWSRYGKQYPMPDNLIRREEFQPYEPSAMELAAKEIEEDKKRIARLEELKLLDKARADQALEKEKIRKDRELLMTQLESLAKEDKQLRPQIPVS